MVSEPVKIPGSAKSKKSSSSLEKAPESIKPKTLEERIEEIVIKQMVAWAPNIAVKLAGLLPNLILIPYFTFFLLKDARTFKKTLIEWIPNRYFEPSLKFFYEMGRRMRSYLRNLLLDCFLVGILVGVCSALVGAPYPMVFGIIAFFLNSIPLVGPLLYGIIFVVITLGAGKDSEIVLGVIGVFLLSRICDDLVFQPTIYGKSHHIHPVVVICAILIGETVAGLWGMFLAIPVLSILFLGIGIIREISLGEDAVRPPPSAFAPFT
jgi:predicted PurR-regulated permease PerM